MSNRIAMEFYSNPRVYHKQPSVVCAIEDFFGLVDALPIEAAAQATGCVFAFPPSHLTNGQGLPDQKTVLSWPK
jgi:hypothetical protein